MPVKIINQPLLGIKLWCNVSDTVLPTNVGQILSVNQKQMCILYKARKAITLYSLIWNPLWVRHSHCESLTLWVSQFCFTWICQQHWFTISFIECLHIYYMLKHLIIFLWILRISRQWTFVRTISRANSFISCWLVGCWWSTRFRFVIWLRFWIFWFCNWCYI